MDPLTKRNVGTLTVLALGVLAATDAQLFPEAVEVHAAVAGVCLAVGILRFIDDRRIARERNEVLRRFLRPRFSLFPEPKILPDPRSLPCSRAHLPPRRPRRSLGKQTKAPFKTVTKE